MPALLMASSIMGEFIIFPSTNILPQSRDSEKLYHPAFGGNTEGDLWAPAKILAAGCTELLLLSKFRPSL